jgi:hypothetical protein
MGLVVRHTGRSMSILQAFEIGIALCVLVFAAGLSKPNLK